MKSLKKNYVTCNTRNISKDTAKKYDLKDTIKRYIEKIRLKRYV
jgi:hypothetical protein